MPLDFFVATLLGFMPMETLAKGRGSPDLYDNITSKCIILYMQRITNVTEENAEDTDRGIKHTFRYISLIFCCLY